MSSLIKDFIHRFKSRPIKLVWCHRLPERSWHFRGKPVLCWRCTGITVGFFIPFVTFIALLSAIIMLLIPFSPLLFVPNIWWFLIVVALIIPLVADGFSQGLGYRQSNNVIRFITGTLYGIGMSLGLYIVAFYILVFFSSILP